MSETDPIREKIIAAAATRFRHYGYPKTTIAELACDCAMSAGNIYRFFGSKIDIAGEIARREALHAVEKVEAVLACPHRSARQRLEETMFADLRYTFHLFENQPKILELAQIVVRERPHFHAESLWRERHVLHRILNEGRDKGEFAVPDVHRTAIALQAATLKYRYAQLFTEQTLSELERELAAVLSLLIRGLMPPAAQADFTPTEIPPVIDLSEMAEIAEKPLPVSEPA